jgi:hypothetical protein
MATSSETRQARDDRAAAQHVQMTKGDDKSRLAIDRGGQHPVTDVHTDLHLGMLGHAIPPESPILIGRVMRGRSFD